MSFARKFLIAWNRARLYSPSSASLVSMLAHFHEMPIQVGKPVKGGRMLFQPCTYLGVSQKKGIHGSQALIQTFYACGNQTLLPFVKIIEMLIQMKTTFGSLFFFLQKMHFLTNIERCPNFLDQALAAVTMQKSGPIIWVNSQYAETE